MRSLRLFALTWAALLLILSLLLPHTVSAAQIKVSVDRNPVGIDDSFQIIFSAAEAPDDDPDFSPLEQDFEIINQSNSSSASWINGKASKTIQWTLTVMARQAGTFMIPSIKFGKDATSALPITVTQGAVSQNLNTDEDIILEVEATPEQPYVQSQIVYTVRVFTRVEIARASMNEPELADAVIEKLVQDSNYTTQINGVDYSVTERKYAIFPQKSGMITIQPLVLTADVMTNRRQSFNSFFSSQLTKTKRVSSKAITMDVKPVPPSYTGQHWLAAEQVLLKESWSGDKLQMRVGEPLTRTLTLQAKASTVGQLPELNTFKENEQIKVYPDQPALQEQKNPDGLLSQREEKIAFIPSKAGSYTLPAIVVPWFNTRTQTMETATIPETLVTVVATTGTEPKIEAPMISQPAQENTQPRPAMLDNKTAFWQGISLFLAAGWIATLVFFLMRRPELRRHDHKHPENGIGISESVKKLKKACADNDAQGAKNAIIQWGRKEFNVSSLGAIAACCDARLRDEILYLSSILYGKEDRQWQGKKLFQAFAENKARAVQIEKEDNGLEPLYRL